MPARPQPSLFQDAHPAMPISGLSYDGEVVTEAEAGHLSAFIGHLPLQPFAYRGFTGKRRTVSFGWRYDFNGGGFQRAAAMPAQLQHARAKIAEALGQVALEFEQCSVLEYAPGAGIGWHKDRPHFGKVAGLSLLAPCRLRFRRPADGGWQRQSISLEPRSAYLLEGEARAVWQHSIAPLEQLRYSVTFRSLTKDRARSDAALDARVKR